MAEIKRENLPTIPPIDVVGLITTGATIVNATLPFIKELFAKIGELVKTIHTDKLSRPRGKRLAIEALRKEVDILQAQNELQKKWNSALIRALKDAGIAVSDTEG